jgi:hypothetical protein
VKFLCGLLFLAASTAAAIPLQIVAPPAMKTYQQQIAAAPQASYQPLLELTGTREPQTVMRVLLAPEGSELARSAPRWVSGWTAGYDGVIVLIPSRAERYPDDGVDELLRHEMTHVLEWRAAGGHGIPRWFNEGLAMFAARGWQLEDRSRLTLEMLRGEDIPLASLDRAFDGNESEVTRAYALSGAMVRDLIDRHGRGVTGRILDALRHGRSFDEAFSGSTGETLASAEQEFWRRQTIWNRWVPFLTSTLALWLFITALGLLAMGRRRALDRQRMEAWEDETSMESELEN